MKKCALMQLELDASRGYAAIPDVIHRIKMSDGAYRLLIILCAHAKNSTGLCDPSHAYLADLMGKSKASITNHLNELRRLGLVETTSKIGRAGGNGGLHILVTFWKAWRQSVREAGEARRKAKSEPRRVQQGECLGVQQDERVIMNHTINHTPPTPPTPEATEASGPQPSPQVEVVVNRMIDEWSDAIGRGNTYGSWAHRPAPSLVSATQRLLQEHRPPSTDTSTIIPAIQGKLQSIWQGLRVTVAPNDLAAQAKSVIKSTPDPLPLLTYLARCIQSAWPKHHRRAPPLPQFITYLNEAREKAGVSLGTKLKKLASDLGRYHTTFGQEPVTT